MASRPTQAAIGIADCQLRREPPVAHSSACSAARRLAKSRLKYTVAQLDAPWRPPAGLRSAGKASKLLRREQGGGYAVLY